MTQTTHERQLRNFIARVKAGRMSRRAFVRKMVGLGLTAPLASQMLAYAGVAPPRLSSITSRTSAAGEAR